MAVRKACVAVVLAFAVLAAPMLSGCYGTFALSKAVYKFNGAFDNKWVRTGIFWGFLILPVYNFAALGDALVLNAIEFWTDTKFAGGRGVAPGLPASEVAAAPAR